MDAIRLAQLLKQMPEYNNQGYDEASYVAKYGVPAPFNDIKSYQEVTGKHLNDEFKEDPNGIPNNLFPYLCKVHQGKLKELTIYGSDYNTRDGTCSRDFIHVVDVANAHKICCDNMINDRIKGIKIYNVGTGIDTTVLELIKTFEKVNNTQLKYKLRHYIRKLIFLLSSLNFTKNLKTIFLRGSLSRG